MVSATIRTALTGLALCLSLPAAADDMRYGGKIVLTNGISSLEGASGGGLTPWAVIAGNETRDGIGVQASGTTVEVRDYSYRSAGVAIGVFDRVEVSYTRQRFDTKAIGALLGLGRGFAFDQDVWGAKLKLTGDMVYGRATTPAIAVGVQYKKNLDAPIVAVLGAKHSTGLDAYVTASKLLLSRSILASGTARLTKANQTGLLGYGGDRSDRHDLQFEGSIAWQLSRSLAIGGEYRTKPDKLGVAREDDWLDAFAAVAIGRHLTATAAYTDLGSIATRPKQRGMLLQLQAGF